MSDAKPKSTMRQILESGPTDALITQKLDFSPNIELRGFAAVWLRNLWPERILPILQEIEKTISFGTPAGTQVYIAMRELEQAKEKAAAGHTEPDAKS